MKKWINKFRKKSTTLTNEEKVSVARAKIETAFSTFTKIHSEIEEINDGLKEVIMLENKNIEKTIENRDNAQDELSMNEAMQERLAQFIR